MQTKDINIENLHAECLDMKPVKADWQALANLQESGIRGFDTYKAFRANSGRVYVLQEGEGDCIAFDLSGFKSLEDDEPWQEYAIALANKGVIKPGLMGSLLISDHPDDFDEVAEAIENEQIDDLCEGPMMNYYYPLHDLERYGFDPREAARAIVDLPLCVVEFSDEAQDNGAPDYALALTGGGQDLTWEICEAFVRIGQLPPLHFCELPAISGRCDDSPYCNLERDLSIVAACRKSIAVKKFRLLTVETALNNLTREKVVAG